MIQNLVDFCKNNLTISGWPLSQAERKAVFPSPFSAFKSIVGRRKNSLVNWPTGGVLCSKLCFVYYSNSVKRTQMGLEKALE